MDARTDFLPACFQTDSEGPSASLQAGFKAVQLALDLMVTKNERLYFAALDFGKEKQLPKARDPAAPWFRLLASVEGRGGCVPCNMQREGRLRLL